MQTHVVGLQRSIKTKIHIIFLFTDILKFSQFREIKEDLVPPGLRAVEASVVRPVPTEFREHPGNEERVEMTG